MKKIVILVLLTLCLVAGLSAQTISVGLDTIPLFKGIIWSDSDQDNSLFALSPVFEYRIAPHYSIGAGADLWFGEYWKKDFFYFGLAAHGRWYPLDAGLSKLFLDAGLGFNMLSIDGDKADSEHGGFTGLTVGLKAGWKHRITGNFFVEPSMAYTYTKTPNELDGPTIGGWQAGLILGVVF
jgi:hypothetical protein